MPRARFTALIAASVVGALAAGAAAETAPRVRPWLGISISDRGAWGGVAVLDVYDDTPASLCGLRASDEIVGVGRAEVRSTTELQMVIGAHDVGDKVTVSYVRNGEVKRCRTRLAPQVTDPTELLHRRVVDKALPTFTAVRASDDEEVTERSLRGRVTVLAVFSTSCDRCADAVAALSARLDGKRAGVLAIVPESKAAIDAYVQRVGLTAEVATDQGDLVRRLLADRDDVTLLVVDHKGVVRFAASGLGAEDDRLDDLAFCVDRAIRARRKAT